MKVSTKLTLVLLFPLIGVCFMFEDFLQNDRRDVCPINKIKFSFKNFDYLKNPNKIINWKIIDDIPTFDSFFLERLIDFTLNMNFPRIIFNFDDSSEDPDLIIERNPCSWINGKDKSWSIDNYDINNNILTFEKNIVKLNFMETSKAIKEFLEEKFKLSTRNKRAQLKGIEEDDEDWYTRSKHPKFEKIRKSSFIYTKFIYLMNYIYNSIKLK